MTREEFNSITTVFELVEAGEQYDFEETTQIYSADSRDEVLDERLIDYARDDGWRDVLGLLRSWEDEGEYDWYYQDDDYYEFVGLEDGDHTFEAIKERLREYIVDDCGGFDDDDDFDEEFTKEVEIEQELESWADDEFKEFVSEFQIV